MMMDSVKEWAEKRNVATAEKKTLRRRHAATPGTGPEGMTCRVCDWWDGIVCGKLLNPPHNLNETDLGGVDPTTKACREWEPWEGLSEFSLPEGDPMQLILDEAIASKPKPGVLYDYEDFGQRMKQLLMRELRADEKRLQSIGIIIADSKMWLLQL